MLDAVLEEPREAGERPRDELGEYLDCVPACSFENSALSPPLAARPSRTDGFPTSEEDPGREGAWASTFAAADAVPPPKVAKPSATIEPTIANLRSMPLPLARQGGTLRSAIMDRGSIEVDYLVIGTGAAGMAFTDALISESDATVLMVDRRHGPGGHWNDAYPFVRLHQPSAFYGVNSRNLGEDRIDDTGPNAGFYERATAAGDLPLLPGSAERAAAPVRPGRVPPDDHLRRGRAGVGSPSSHG